MGSGVSTDEEPLEIGELTNLPYAKMQSGQGPGRCVRAWAFKKDAKAEAIALISVTPSELHVDRSYLILSITERQSEDSQLEDEVKSWAQFVISVMTPRGILTPVTVLDRFASGIQCSVWVWNGTASPWSARNGALMTAIHLDRQLQAESSVKDLLDCATAHVNSCVGPQDNPKSLTGTLAQGFRRLLGCVSAKSPRYPNLSREIQTLSKVLPAEEPTPIVAFAKTSDAFGSALVPPIKSFKSHASDENETPRTPPFMNTPRIITPRVDVTPREEKWSDALKVVGLGDIDQVVGPTSSERGRKRDICTESFTESARVKRNVGLDLLHFVDTEREDYNLSEKQQRERELDQHRSVCSEIIPKKLYLSGHLVAANRTQLKTHGITHIINCAADVCTNNFEDEFTHLTYYLKDTKHEDISAVFYRTIDYIDAAIQAGGRVLVHCREGVSRSSTLVAAYLMYQFRVDTASACNKVREVRAICNPNAGFYCQLIVLQKQLQIEDARGNGSSRSSDVRLNAYRVKPHDAREPFLLLFNFEFSRKVDAIPYDPRFGFVLRLGNQILGWIGQSCPNKEEVKNTIVQHVKWVKKYEGVLVHLNIFDQGDEPQLFWDWNKVQGPGPPRFAEMRTEFDADMKILMDVRDGFSSPPGSSRSALTLVSSLHPDAEMFDTHDISKPIHRHDSDDLDATKSFLLRSRTRGHLFLWIGEGAHEIAAQEAAQRFLKDNNEELKLTVIRQGSEPSSFWEYFEDG